MLLRFECLGVKLCTIPYLSDFTSFVQHAVRISAVNCTNPARCFVPILQELNMRYLVSLFNLVR